MTGKPRRSYEAGHRPKFLVVVDETPECDKALYFAARRAGRIGADLLMLWVINPPDYQHWMGVGDLMKAEAEEDANRHLETAAERVRAVAAIEPQRAIRTGPRAEEIVKLIEEDEDISLLILAAGTSNDGPGPLVTYATKAAASFPVPIAIVPGQLADKDIDALA